MIEIGPERYGAVRDLFRPLEWHLVSRAVLEGETAGRCLVDRADGPRAALLTTPEGYFLAGDAAAGDFVGQANRWLHAEGGAAFYVLADGEGWTARMPDLLAPRPPIALARSHYLCTQVEHDWRAALPPGFEVAAIDAGLLDRREIVVPEHVRRWIRSNWGDTGRYLERGFGAATLHADEVVSWSLADCVVDDVCEIGIHTSPPFRRRGLAAVTAAACAEIAFSRGLRLVGWQCSDRNRGSVGTAKRVGFVHERSYVLHYALADEVAHLVNMAEAEYDRAAWRDCLGLLDRVFASTDEAVAHAHLLAAASRAALGQPVRAFEHLREAAGSDPALVERWALDTPELEHLSTDGEWKAIFGGSSV